MVRASARARARSGFMAKVSPILRLGLELGFKGKLTVRVRGGTLRRVLAGFG